MQDVNWWLMALAFLLGLVLTLALMIRRVKREVPEYATLAAGARVRRRCRSRRVRRPRGRESPAAKSTAAAERPRRDPYGRGFGPGRRRRRAHRDGGYTVKGNEDSMLYHTTDSPSYKQTIAEVWFRDVETAEAAGFKRWDSGKSQRGQR